MNTETKKQVSHNHLEVWTFHADCPRCQQIKAAYYAEKAAKSVEAA